MIAKHVFGRSGHMSSRILLGGVAFAGATQDETDASMELALSYGINHVDVAASYGEAELRVGSWIKRHGKIPFLATKTGQRIASKAKEEIFLSLERLQVDQVDLLQLHNLVDPHEWETALGPGGALEAAIQAREQGLVRFIGVTGHGLTAPAMHLKAIELFDFDSVLLPFSFLMIQNKQYHRDFMNLMSVCRDRNIAVQTIKSLVRSPWGDRQPNRATWYQPLEEQGDIDLAVHWVLGHPGVFLNTAGDVHILPKVIDAADRYVSQPSDEEMRFQIEKLEMRSLFS